MREVDGQESPASGSLSPARNGKILVVVLCLFAGWQLAATQDQPQSPAPLDPVAWGSDHVGQEIPEYIESGECLFCHRNDVGNSWARNRHNLTVRDADPAHPALVALSKKSPIGNELAAEVTLLIGHERAIRFARRSKRYGHLDLLTIHATAGRSGRFRLAEADTITWDEETFNARCAGCHATAVDPEDHSFATASLDCFACHGDAPLEHANDPKLMPLSKARQDSPRVVTSICAQCHVRVGRSRSSGRPYPNNFVAGDNLFRDFEMDFSKADDPAVSPADRHVLQNVRDVVVLGREDVTCLSCHDVHRQKTEKHRDLADRIYCQVCHPVGQPKKQHLVYEVHSTACEY